MALVYCINVNFCSLVNTFCSKGISKAKRFISLYGSKTSLNSQHADKITYHNLFKRMMDDRQNQARRSIVVKIKSLHVFDNFQQFCRSFGKISNIFPYTTIHKQCFVLVEFESTKCVKQIMQYLNGTIHNSESMNMYSSIFYYVFEECNKTSQMECTRIDAFYLPEQIQIMKKIKSVNSLEEQITALYYSLKLLELDTRLRFHTAKELTYYLSRLFVNLNVIPFGSSVNGFGQRGCDLDLVCTISNTTSGNSKKLQYLSNHVNFDSREKHQQFLETAYIILNTCVPTIYNMKRILNARVPILKFCISNTNMKCDLTSPNYTSVEMSKLLYLFAEMDYRVKPLVCTIRKWAQAHEITKEQPGPWITNFSLTLLVIFYLQINNILPSIQHMNMFAMNSVQQNKLPTMWNSLNSMNLGDALIGFFRFYQTFDFKMRAICIRRGKTRSKLTTSPVYIYNPLEESLNVTKNINQIYLTRFIDHLQDAYHVLTDGKQYAFLRLLKFDITSEIKNIDSEQRDNIEENIVEKKQSELGQIFNLTEPKKVKEIIN